MIYDVQNLMVKYKSYSNINQKVSLECKKGNLIRIKRGLYTDDLSHDLEAIANICYGPSYISFEYALSYYGIIPEHVSTITSATYDKKNNKSYLLKDAAFEYRCIPKSAFPIGIKLMKTQNGCTYKIASKEKALCDMLYSQYPVRSISDLKVLLFDDLRIDENELMSLDKETIKEIAPLYHSNTLNVFSKYVVKGI